MCLLIRIEEVRSEMYDVNHLSAIPLIPILANRDMRRLNMVNYGPNMVNYIKCYA